LSDNTLAVRITADVVDLQTKFAIAQAQVRGLTSEMNKLATASAKGIIDSAGSDRLQQVAGDLLHARSETASLAGAMGAAGVSIGGFGGRMGEARISVGAVAREMRMLSRDVQSGSGAGAEVALIRLAHSLLGLGPAALLGVGAVAGLAVGLGYLAIQAIKSAHALDSIKIGADLAGNLDVTREKIQAMTTELERSSNISGSAARAIVADLTSIPGMVGPALDAGTALVGRFIGAFGLKAEEAGKELKKFLQPDVSAAKLADDLSHMGAAITTVQREAADAADRTGNANAVLAEKYQLIDQLAQKTATDQAQSDSSRTASLTNYLGYMGMELQGIDAEAVALEDVNKKWELQSQLIRSAGAALLATPQTPEQTISKGVEVAKKDNPIVQQVDEAKAKVEELKSALIAAQAAGDKVNVRLLNSDLTETREKLSALQFGPVLERMRAEMAQVASTWDGTQSGMLEKQRQVAAQVLGEVRKGSKEYLAVQTEMAHLDVQIRQTAGQELIAVVRTQNAAINGDVALSATQRLERERDAWTGILGSDRLTAAQRLEVQKEFNTASAALAKALQAEKQAIARSDADTNIAIARMGIEAEKQALDEKLQLNQVSAGKKLQILKSLTDQEYQLDLKGLQDELALLHQGTAEYERVYNQIRELKAKLNLDLAALDRQAAADAAKQAQQQYNAWKTAVGEIENAESTMIGDILSHRKTFAQSLTSVMQTMVQKEIENDVKAMTTHLMLKTAEGAKDKALEQGGFLYHSLMGQKAVADDAAIEAKKTAAAAAGLVSRPRSPRPGKPSRRQPLRPARRLELQRRWLRILLR
jgi:hypothetical protein